MKKKHKYRKKNRTVPILTGIAIILALIVTAMLLFLLKTGLNDVQKLQVQTVPTVVPPVETTRETESTVPSTEETTLPVETEPQILPYFVEMAEQNPDMVGWVKVDGTKLDYPLMYTPSEPEKYLHKDFDGNFSVGGLPFIEEDCSLDPRSDNLIIYGHNMANGTMFHSLMEYEKQAYWEAHPVIHLSSLYEEKPYQIIAAFYDRIYLKTDTCFKFYQFIDAQDEAAFQEAISYFKEKSLYDTGVTAEYGDKLITLVTCAYHVDNGRFVVVAKEANADHP